MKNFRACEPYKVNERLNGEHHQVLKTGAWKRVKRPKGSRSKTALICRYHAVKAEEMLETREI